MRKFGLVLASLMTAACSTLGSAPSTSDDPYAWLEDVNAPRSLDWVRAQNDVSSKEFEADASFKPLEQRLLSIYDSKDKIPFVGERHGQWYNFWQDADHVRGLWRRASPAEFRKAQPKWETVLDLDALSASEKESWVWKGAICLHPDDTRCLVSLSRGGGDAVVVREFDLLKKQFVQDGFTLPEAKTQVGWRDLDTIYVATDFGAGTLTDSGYARIVKEWKRGTPLASARTLFEAKTTDVGAEPIVAPQPDGVVYEGVLRTPAFFKSETLLRRGDALVKLELPEDADASFFRDQLLVQLRTDWKPAGTNYPAGSLLAISLEKFLAGERRFDSLYVPSPKKSLVGFAATRNVLLVTELEDVATHLYTLRHKAEGWHRKALNIPKLGTVAAWGVDPLKSDEYFMTVTNYVTPTQLLHGTLGPGAREPLKQMPAFFKATGLAIEQHFATSKDGTRVPYFQVSRKDLKLDGKAPALLYGYGGFEISELPHYSGGVGAAWLERGGVFIEANIRGGGEYGPAWHQAALKENRQRAYDDFIAIAEDLVARKITSPQHLGIMGGSNGGLLMGVMFTQRPDLFGAVSCQVPLLDMKRYSHLLAGASWMAEYGDPDQPDEWAYISKYSPYQNVKAGVKYPRVLFTTSTHDDRVHPGHARKMVARMLEQHHDVLYHENTEGGHAGSATNAQKAHMDALTYTFLWKQLQ